jgi:hypothetical protein
MIDLRGCVVTCALLLAPLAPAGAQTGSEPTGAPGVRAGIQVRTLEVRDLSFGSSRDLALSIERVVFRGFASSGNRVRADRIDVERIVIKAGSQTTEIPALAITGADLPAPLFRALVEGQSAADWAALVAQSAIEEISIETMVQRDPSADTEIVHKEFTFRDFKNGIVASARLGGLAGTVPGEPGSGKQVGLRMGEIRYQQIDIAESIRFFTGGTGGPAKRLLQRATVDGIEVRMPDGGLRFDRVELAGIEGRAPQQALPAAAHRKGGLDDAQVRAQVITYATEALRTARIDRYSIEGIRVEIPGQGRFAVKAVTLEGLSARGLERFEIRGVDMPTPDVTVRFDRFVLTGLTYGAMVDAALEAARSGEKPNFPPDKIARIRPHLSGLRLTRLDVETPMGPVSVDDVRFEIDELGGATKAEAAIVALKVDVERTQGNPGREKLIELGFREMVLSAELRIRALPQERAIVLETLAIAVDRAGRVEATARLDNIDIAKILANPETAESELGVAVLGPLQLRLVNFGLAERFYASTAKSAGISEDAMRAGLAAEMRAKALQGFAPILLDRSADAIAAFLQSPKAIVARVAVADGQKPPTVAELQAFNPPLLMERLRVKLEALP